MSEHNFVISTESGTVQGYDTRKANETIFEIQAHEQACSNVSFSPHIAPLMATCSTDQYVKIWDISNTAQPTLVAYKKLNMGELFTLQFYKDIPWVLAAGGSKGELAVWDIEENETIAKHFAPFIDKTKMPSQDFAGESDDNDMSDEENEKKKVKKD